MSRDGDEDYDLLFKLLLIGDSGVGKSSILVRFVDNEFDEDRPCTIGVDFKNKKLMCRGSKVSLQIWDTAGQEKFRSLTSSYYRGTEGIILVYDVTDRDSFKDIEQIWLREIDLYSTKKDVVKLLVGNKIDLPNRQVSKEEARDFARNHNLAMYIETSAKTKNGIQQAFVELVEKILDDPSVQSQSSKSSGGLNLNSAAVGSEESSSEAFCSC